MVDAGGGVALSAPPVTGLGNFKGVMLCNRPSDGPAARGGGDDGPLPFKSMVSASHGDKLGLPPCKAAEGTEVRGVKKRGPSAALRQHVRWLRELQTQMKGERDQVESEEQGEEERKRRMRTAAERHREGVRAMIAERQEANETAAESKVVAAAAPADGANARKARNQKKVVKPLWALTEQEKEDFFDDEANDLINFAENLDFEKYLGDLEFREGIDALKDRAGKLSKEQDAFKDALVRDFNAALDDEATTSAGSPRSSMRLEDGIDGQSVLAGSEYSTCSRRSKGQQRYGNEQADWDSSTACGEDKPQVDRAVKDAAAAVLESAPQIKAIHSKESVSRIIERARAKDEEHNLGLVETMRRDGPTQAPVITASEDTQQRLHKPVDPSNLPYLYRSPAI